MMRPVDVLIIGGGAAGLAAAAAARRQGAGSVLILERSAGLGGVLRQCIHNGFGLHQFREDLTGTEYAKRYTDLVQGLEIPYRLNTFVLSVSSDLKVEVISPDGLDVYQAKAVVLAMGCRERARGSLLIPGTRPAGVLTAGTAQRYLNLEGYLPGRRVVILGSGDIGLIMARQFAIEGAQVACVVEIMPYSSGLLRNIAQCLDDFAIPIRYNSTVIEIKGQKRVEAVTVVAVDACRRPVPGTEQEIPCDTLLISAGLIPENELTREAGITIDAATRGARVDETLQTSLPGIFACGNVLHVHDLVDYVSRESEMAGKNAALFAQGRLPAANHIASIPVLDGEGISGAVPQFVSRTGAAGSIRFMFRSRQAFRDVALCVYADARCVKRVKKRVLTPGEMNELLVERVLLDGSSRVRICVEEG